MTSYDLIWQLIDMLLAEKSKAEETNEDIVGSRSEIAVRFCFF